MKVIFIAGNEAFTQGKVDYKKSCREAIEKGIVVNTIFCGNFEKGVRTNWKDGALLADGKYMNIDQNQQIVHIEAPQDQEIMRLGRELNKTYISYGAMGREKKERQATQDSMASGIAPSVMVQRSVTKSSKMYKNKSWDLVDAVEEGEVTPEDLDAEDLPAEMRDMNTDERKAYVESKKKERAKIQAKIKQLNAAREAYVAEERKKMSRTNTLDAAIIDAIKTQAEKKSYKFDNSGNLS